MMTVKLKDGIAKYFLLCSAAFSIVALLAIALFLFSRGIPAMAEIGLFKFLFGTVWHNNPGATNQSYGVLPMILGSIYVTALATMIGLTIGIFIAVFIFKFCPKKIRGILEQLINLLGGIPSVVFGLFGILVVVPALRQISPTFVGEGILAASLILSIMILPTIVTISLNSLKAVPRNFYEGALALGATKEQSVFKVVLPAAKSGVYTAVVLSIGRAIGETMAVIMVIGGSPQIPTSWLQSIDTLTALIARNSGEASGLAFEALIACGVVLFVFTILLNVFLMTVKIKRTNQSYKLTLKRHNERQAQKLIDHTSFLHLRVALLYKRTKFFIKYPFVKLGQFFVWLVVVCKLNVICRQLSELLDKNWRAESRQKAWYAFLKVSSFFAAFLGVLALVGLILFILIRGTPYVSWHFVFGKYTLDNPTLTPAIVGTLILVGIALCISIPIGVGSAIFLSEYARKAKGVKYIRLAIDSLAAIPSIVYGLFGFIFFVGLFGWSYSLLAGGVTLAIMTLPTVIRITEESLLTVPHIYREGSVALGASKVRTTFKVVLPCASVGIASALIQTVGRVISESAVLILTIGLMVNIVPDGVMSPGTSLALNIYYFGNFGSSDQAAATCVVLLIVVLLLNLVLSFVGKRLGRNNFKY